MKFSFFQRLSRQRGASATEYGLLVGLVAVGMIVAVSQTGGSISALFQKIVDTLLGKRIELSYDHVAENAPTGSLVGTLSYKGMTGADGATFTTPDAQFIIEGNLLKTAVSFDFETTHSVSLPVIAHVAGETDYSENLVITIANENEAPAAPVLTCAAGCTQVPENSTTVGTVTAADPDGDTLTLTLPTHALYPQNDYFTIDAAGNLATKAGTTLDYESGVLTYTLLVVATDAGGLSRSSVVSFTIINQPDVTPTVAVVTPPSGFSVTNSSATDAASGVTYVAQTLTFQNTGEIATAALAAPTLTPATGSGFVVKENNCLGATLMPNGENTCTVVVWGVATANGALTGATLNLGGSTTALSGTASGLTAALAFDASSPTTVSNFSASTRYSDCTSLVLKNTGHLPISTAITGALSGTQAVNFAMCTANSNPCGSSLAIGATCNVGVRGKALLNGTYTATVTANASGVSASPTQNISLTASDLIYARCQDILTWAGTLGLTAADGQYNLYRGTPPRYTLFPAYCDMTADGGGWTMVYKHSTGVAADVYTAFTSGASAGSVPTSKTSKDGSDYIDGALISAYVVSSGKIRLSVHSGGAEVKYLRFNGTSNITSWFSQSALEAASWTDLKDFDFAGHATVQGNTTDVPGLTPVFDIYGHPQYNRQFFINWQYGGCNNDAGWFAVTSPSGADACGTAHGFWGDVRYTTGTTWNFRVNQATADSMAIWIR